MTKQKTYRNLRSVLLPSEQAPNKSNQQLDGLDLTVQDECKQLRKFHCCVKSSLVGCFLFFVFFPGMFAKHFKNGENLETVKDFAGFL